MTNKFLLKSLALATLLVSATAITAQEKNLEPLIHRVGVQTDSARLEQIIGGEWVGVGTKAIHAIQLDSNIKFEGQPSYRFELQDADNTLAGYSKGETKGRAELSYCYAISSDFDGKPASAYDDAQKIKTVYHNGKGIIPQASKGKYEFSIYVPSELSSDVQTIFAQWHGMPNRTLVQTPDGEIKQISDAEFLELYSKMEFKKNLGHDRVAKTDKEGKVTYRTSKEPNGWIVEQGGYPPLAFGFSGGYFYIKANSDSKWLTDKTDRTLSSASKHEIMKPVKSKYKTSTIAYKEPFSDFPKNCWVTFVMEVDWTKYNTKTDKVVRPGRIDVVMKYKDGDKEANRHIVDNEKILIGRNDEDGYYFKFGIYRVGGSTTPVLYNLAGYSQE